MTVLYIIAALWLLAGYAFDEYERSAGMEG